nr:immunoglobulin light chain junction region [Macaca mulatta]MOV77801.1 immunoglobulin light chain junction region [Macaca mulatta]MOV77901.1 immunoglobulin light chain junction region [Macaca mulatta]MOV78410.1 immunoglobulin light chain junction region [Macaca mulatta]MOV78655.1 immunoglobulin light chain junction region [Macaca mulatta]
CQQYDSDLFTF